jgi:hypothetical protein
MELKERIVNALVQTLKAEYVRLEDDDGITGFVVSPEGEGHSLAEKRSVHRNHGNA